MGLDRFVSVPRYARASFAGLWAQHGPPSDKARSFTETTSALLAMAETVWSARRAIADFLRTGDPAVAFGLRRRFGLTDALDRAPQIGTQVFEGQPIPTFVPPATIVIPVYNAARSVAQLLDHLPDTLPAGQRVIVADDGSNAPDVGQIIARFAQRWPAARLMRNQTNQGFVATVTQAMALADADHHIILLNSDCLPPSGWVPRLLAPIARNDRIASVTPLSNNAQILSVPEAEIDGQISTAFVAALDDVARRLNTRDIPIPTGVGFCMALNRRFLDMIGGFDAAFGRGYGEEVDWCLRAEQSGGRHVAVSNLFVGHEGASSFGHAVRAKRVRQAARLVTTRYPGFRDQLSQWDKTDPLRPERLALAIGWLNARAKAPVPVFIGHLMGGGAETALQTEVSTLLAKGHPGVLILRAGGPHLWRVELVGRRFCLTGDVATADVLHRLLAPLKTRRVVYSCGVGTADARALPETLIALAQTHQLELRLHDFFPISPSWNLIDSQGRFAGIPPIDTVDTAHSQPALCGQNAISHAEWRQAWGRVMARANHIQCFAPSGADLLCQAYPHAKTKIEVRPHNVNTLPGQLRKGGPAIGVLGGINLAKGGRVLEHLAKATDRRIVVIGELEGCFHLNAPHHVHGRYTPRQIKALATRHQVGLWLIPSICPETFSFATAEALSTGLPVLSFDLGAQADALRAAPNGHVTRVAPDDGPGLAKAIEDICDASGR